MWFAMVLTGAGILQRFHRATPRPLALAPSHPFYRCGHWARTGSVWAPGRQPERTSMKAWGTLLCTSLPPWVALEGRDVQCPRIAGRPHQSQAQTGAGEAEGTGAAATCPSHTPRPAVAPGRPRARYSLAKTGRCTTGSVCLGLDGLHPRLSLWIKGASVCPRAPQEKPQRPQQTL